MINCKNLIKNSQINKLIESSLPRVETYGGEYFTHNIGIPQGSPLSPLLGAIALHQLDFAMRKIKGVFYARYMDDWVVLCKTKNQLRKIIKITHEIIDELKFKLHPDKTFIGKIEKGFDFLGYHITPETLKPAKATIERAHQKIKQLYEQGADLTRIALYWKRFLAWVHAGVDVVEVSLHDKANSFNNITTNGDYFNVSGVT